MNETRPDSVALHAMARRERSRLMAHLIVRLVHAIARGVHSRVPLGAGRAVAN